MKKLSLLFLSIAIIASCKPKTEAPKVKETTTLETSTSKEPYAHEYVYKSENGEHFDVTFYEDDGIMYIKLSRADEPVIILPQTTAWAKGAEYEKDGIQWISQGDQGTFTQNGVTTTYTQQN